MVGIFPNFRYIAKYSNSEGIKILVSNMRASLNYQTFIFWNFHLLLLLKD